MISMGEGYLRTYECLSFDSRALDPWLVALIVEEVDSLIGDDIVRLLREGSHATSAYHRAEGIEAERPLVA